ncbi:MAG: polymorphic toxin-type HINT domain-containing protein, partial [Planctomycetota bacterium]
MLPLNLPELEVSGLALVTAIDDCPPIAGGEGSVVTARFVTREVHVVASVDVLGADGTVETITGTTIHPVWSVDRQEWVPLAELADGETLQGLDGLAVVLGVSLSRVSQQVYNIEVHGEHVYQVGELGVVVHNTCTVIGRMDDLKAFDGIPAEIIDT